MDDPHWTEAAFVEHPGVFRAVLEARVDNAAPEARGVLALLAEHHDLVPATALDVACGIGRHAVPLAEHGVEVTGVDISGTYLRRARERAAEAGVGAGTAGRDRGGSPTGTARFVRADMRDLAAVGGEFDLVTNMWTSLGYYDAAADRAILRGMAERVAEDGALLLELVDREGVTGAGFAADGVYETDDLLAVESREYDPETARMATEREVFRRTDDGYDHVGTMDYEVRLYAPVELRERLLEVGFGAVTFYEGLSGEPLAHDSTRMVVVAEH